MTAYYNENDKHAAAWLRNLIKSRLIADGEVDERSITDVKAEDVREFTQCHFFAGIGGWSYALRLAGWGDNKPVWTGSCPCQPFSVAGKRDGFSDKRHLWAEFRRLIAECRPDTVFSEQVAGNAGINWFDAVSLDLEKEGYAVGAVVLPACSVGAPHKRDRLYVTARLEDSLRVRRDRGSQAMEQKLIKPLQAERPSAHNRWETGKWAYCEDGKNRPLPEPSIFPLADGIPPRVGLLRGYGNAVVPQVACEVIKAYMAYENKYEID